jgi:hypothetical protein
MYTCKFTPKILKELKQIHYTGNINYFSAGFDFCKLNNLKLSRQDRTRLLHTQNQLRLKLVDRPVPRMNILIGFIVFQKIESAFFIRTEPAVDAFLQIAHYHSSSSTRSGSEQSYFKRAPGSIRLASRVSLIWHLQRISRDHLDLDLAMAPFRAGDRGFVERIQRRAQRTESVEAVNAIGSLIAYLFIA